MLHSLFVGVKKSKQKFGGIKVINLCLILIRHWPVFSGPSFGQLRCLSLELLRNKGRNLGASNILFWYFVFWSLLLTCMNKWEVSFMCKQNLEYKQPKLIKTCKLLHDPQICSFPEYTSVSIDFLLLLLLLLNYLFLFLSNNNVPCFFNLNVKCLLEFLFLCQFSQLQDCVIKTSHH